MYAHIFVIHRSFRACREGLESKLRGFKRGPSVFRCGPREKDTGFSLKTGRERRAKF